MGFENKAEDDGFCKLIVGKSYKILGAHVVGPFAAVLVQQFVYLMNAGYTCMEIAETEMDLIPKHLRAYPDGGSVSPIQNSIIIHPSMNELTAWTLGTLKPVNIKKE